MQEGLSLDSEGIYTIFDTGASDIYLSVLWFESFVEKLYAQVGISYEIKDGKATSKCDEDNFPDIYFSFDYNWVQIRPVDYISRDSASECSLKIRPIDAPFNIMGTPAYVGYYVTHDWGQGTEGGSQLRITPHTDSLLRPVEKKSFDLSK